MDYSAQKKHSNESFELLKKKKLIRMKTEYFFEGDLVVQFTQNVISDKNFYLNNFFCVPLFY